MKILSIDQANKQVQFDVTESASGISFNFTPNANGAVTSENINFRAELISKNESNITLFEGTQAQLSEVLDQIIDFADNKEFFPFANRKNLLLSNDNKIRITIDWKLALNGTGFSAISYDLTTEFEDTVKPLVILKETFSLSEDVNTSNYDYLFLPVGFSSVETVATINSNGVQKQVKQYLTEPAFQSLNVGTKGDRLLKTFSGQKVKITMPEDVETVYYLIQY